MKPPKTTTRTLEAIADDIRQAALSYEQGGEIDAEQLRRIAVEIDAIDERIGCEVAIEHDISVTNIIPAKAFPEIIPGKITRPKARRRTPAPKRGKR